MKPAFLNLSKLVSAPRTAIAMVRRKVGIEHANDDAHCHGAKRKSLHPIYVSYVEGSAGEESDEQYTMQHTLFGVKIFEIAVSEMAVSNMKKSRLEDFYFLPLHQSFH